MYVNLAPIFSARGITQPNKFLIKNGITRNVASSLINGYSRHIKLDHIEILCRALNCEPNDLFQFNPYQGDTLPKDHPLFNLKRDQNAPDPKKLLNSLPYKQLLEVTRSIEQQLNLPSSQEPETL